MIKKEAITGYEDLEIDLYQDKRLEEKKDLWFKSCLRDLDWETGFITIFGKTHQIPRLQAWYADNEVEYTYSGKKLQRHNWNNLLLEIKEKIENITSFKFNSVLANLYRDGNDSMGLHSDDEKELGKNPGLYSMKQCFRPELGGTGYPRNPGRGHPGASYQKKMEPRKSPFRQA